MKNYKIIKMFSKIAYASLMLGGFAGVMFGIMELNQLLFHSLSFDRYLLFRGIMMIIGGVALIKWGYDIKERLNNQELGNEN